MSWDLTGFFLLAVNLTQTLLIYPALVPTMKIEAEFLYSDQKALKKVVKVLEGRWTVFHLQYGILFKGTKLSSFIVP